ncbi:triacylglycerol lipase 2 [Ziziphus jujuba]|uniref:Lipase n=1 Tax=Ziziphus jujuba TaxID=326968 RepID=A0ABM3IHC8_ZIZJJ|nr:triacylglycerol lipase 2 [Ziziphus jujuba]
MANISSTTLILVDLLLCVSAAMAARTKLPAAAGENFSICKSMVETQGYICQEHNVTTPDGYIIGLQRISAAKNKITNYPPVLLQHGIFADAVSWILGSPDESLAFKLADDGFDVWLANTRGTLSSKGHISLTPKDPAYWEWSWDELAAYDLPTFVGYVNNQTGQKLHYVGHSLGTLTALSAFSHGKLLNMLRSAAMLSPIAYLGQMSSLLGRTIAELFLAENLYVIGVREFIPKANDVGKLLDVACSKLGISCSNLLTLFTGPNCCVKTSTIDALLQHEPQPTATKNMMHLVQMVRRGTITKFNYNNIAQNLKHYEQATPPKYNMRSIPKNFPLLLSYGGKDTLSDVNDMQVLLDDLRDHDADKLVIQYREEYAHLDFIMGTNANRIVFDPLIAFFKLH